MIITYTSKRRQRPDITGSNLVSNAGPFRNTTGWFAINSATISVTSNYLKIAYNAVTDPGAFQNVTVEIGELYYFEISVVASGSTYNVLIGDAIYYLNRQGTASATFSCYFVPQNVTQSIVCTAKVSASGFIYVSGVTLQKVTTLGHGALQMNSAGTFDALTSPWTAINSALSIASGKLRITNSGTVYGAAYWTIPTVPGNVYDVSIDYTEGTCTQGTLTPESYLNAADLGLTILMTTTGTTYTGSFTATGTSTVLHIVNNNENNGTNDYDNITVTQSDSEYELYSGMSVANQSYPEAKEVRASLDGTEETVFHREEEIWDISTTAITSRDDLDDWKEFLASVKGGEEFTVDLYQAENPNLISNGTFDSATTGWTASLSSLSVSSRRLRVTNSGAATGSAQTTITTVVGNEYEYFIDIIQGTSASGQVYIGTTAGNAQVLSEVSTNTETISGRFVAESTTTHIALLNTSATNGHYTDWDNVSVRCVETDDPKTCKLRSSSIDRISKHNYRVNFSAKVVS